MNSNKYIYKSKFNWLGLIIFCSFISWLCFFSPNAYMLFPIGIILIWFMLYKGIVWGVFFENSFVIHRPFAFSKRKIDFTYLEISKLTINGNTYVDPPSFSIYTTAEPQKKHILIFYRNTDFEIFLKHLKEKGVHLITTDDSSNKIYKDFINSDKRK